MHICTVQYVGVYNVHVWSLSTACLQSGCLTLLIPILVHTTAYSDPSEEVSRILVGDGDIKENHGCGNNTGSISSSPSSWTRKESMSQLLWNLQQSAKVPQLSGEVSIIHIDHIVSYMYMSIVCRSWSVRFCIKL